MVNERVVDGGVDGEAGGVVEALKTDAFLTDLTWKLNLLQLLLELLLSSS